jgi:hypothetical protein
MTPAGNSLRSNIGKLNLSNFIAFFSDLGSVYWDSWDRSAEMRHCQDWPMKHRTSTISRTLFDKCSDRSLQIIGKFKTVNSGR